jgi:hypothetical protein
MADLLGLPLDCGIERSTGMQHPNPRVDRQQLDRISRAQRVLFFAQIADHAHVEAATSLGVRFQGRRGLKNHMGLGTQFRAQFIAAARLQHDQPRRELHRVLGGRVAANIAIQVGARHQHNQRQARKCCGKRGNRRIAAPRVQRDHQIRARAVPRVRDFDAMTGAAQHARPALRRLRVAVLRDGIGRRNQGDVHGCEQSA